MRGGGFLRWTYRERKKLSNGSRAEHNRYQTRPLKNKTGTCILVCPVGNVATIAVPPFCTYYVFPLLLPHDAPLNVEHTKKARASTRLLRWNTRREITRLLRVIISHPRARTNRNESAIQGATHTPTARTYIRVSSQHVEVHGVTPAVGCIYSQSIQARRPTSSK